MQTCRNLTNIFPKNTKKSPIHENTNAKITCDFCDDWCRIASARLEKDIFVKNHLHTSPIVVKIANVGKSPGVDTDSEKNLCSVVDER